MNKKIIFGVFSVIGVVAIAVLAFLLVNQQNEIKNLKEEVSKKAATSSNEVKTQTENNTSNVSNTVSKKTFESKYSNLKFDYPGNWTLSESQDIKSLQKGYEDYQYYTTLKNKNGKEVVLREAFNGGYGVGCEYGSERIVQSSNVGASKIAGYSAFEVVDGDSDSIFTTSNNFITGNVQYCQTIARNLIVGNANSAIKFNNNDPIIASFSYDGKKSELSEEERKEIIEIISSISLK